MNQRQDGFEVVAVFHQVRAQLALSHIELALVHHLQALLHGLRRGERYLGFDLRVDVRLFVSRSFHYTRERRAIDEASDVRRKSGAATVALAIEVPEDEVLDEVGNQEEIARQHHDEPLSR